MNLTLQYRGINLELEGDFTEAYNGGWEEESFGNEFTVYEVRCGDTDIMDLLNDRTIEQLEKLALEKLS